MKHYYRREMRHNYLVIEPEQPENIGYESHMLEKNLIRGLLRFHVSRPEGMVCFYYEITSKQPLSRILETRSLTRSGLCRVIMGIAEVLEQLEEYLLPEEQLLLDPEYIYADPDTYQIALCLIPGSSQDFPEAVGALLQYFLGYVDHQDKECVVLAYSLYQESQKENFGIGDLLRIVTGEKLEGLSDRNDETKANALQPAAIVSRPQTTKNDRRKKPGKVKPAEAPKRGWKALFTQTTEQLLGKTEPAKYERHDRVAESRPAYETAEWAAWQELLEEPDSETGTNAQRETMREPVTTLLVDLGAESGGYCLRAMQPGLSDIVLKNFPFIIGKNSSLADYLLDRETVSRLHVKISRSEDGFQITDLNSTNGTKVRGRLLANNDEESLKIGDEVQIAEWKYRFDQI